MGFPTSFFWLRFFTLHKGKKPFAFAEILLPAKNRKWFLQNKMKRTPYRFTKQPQCLFLLLKNQSINFGHFVLYTHINSFEKGCFQSTQVIATELGCSVRQVKTLLADLVRFAMITEEKKIARRPVHYRANFPELFALDWEDKSVVQKTTVGSANFAPPQEQTSQLTRPNYPDFAMEKRNDSQIGSANFAPPTQIMPVVQKLQSVVQKTTVGSAKFAPHLDLVLRSNTKNPISLLPTHTVEPTAKAALPASPREGDQFCFLGRGNKRCLTRDRVIKNLFAWKDDEQNFRELLVLTEKWDQEKFLCFAKEWKEQAPSLKNVVYQLTHDTRSQPFRAKDQVRAPEILALVDTTVSFMQSVLLSTFESMDEQKYLHDLQILKDIYGKYGKIPLQNLVVKMAPYMEQKLKSKLSHTFLQVLNNENLFIAS